MAQSQDPELAKQIKQQFDGSELHQRKSLDEEVGRIACVRREVIDGHGQESNYRTEDNQLDTTARESAMTLLNGIVGRLTPPSSIWFGAKEDDSYSDVNKKALERAMRMVFKEITKAKSNFYEAWPETALDGIHFGNMCTLILPGKKRKFNFKSIPNGHYIFLLDDEGYASTVLRKYRMSVSQMEGFFGREGLPKKVLEDLASTDKTRLETKYDVIHRITERKSFSDSDVEVDPEKRQWESVYVYVGDPCILIGQVQESGNIIYKDGMYRNPYKIERLFTTAGKTSGEGITTLVLPKVREIQHSKLQLNMVKDQVAEPSWINRGVGTAEDDFNVPGTIFDVDQFGANNGVERIQSDPNAPAVIGSDLADLRRGIEKAYFVDLFQLFTQQDVSTTEKTRFESQLMKAEQLSLTIVLVKRFIMFLSQVIEDVFDMMDSDGDFAEFSDDFPADYEVEITSPLAKALEGSVEEAFYNTLSFVLQVDPVMPWLKHSADFQAQFTDILINSPMNTKYVRSKKEANQFYEEELEQIRMQQAAATANLAADAAVKASQAQQGE